MMKRIFKAISAIILTIATIIAVGCKPEDHPNNGGNNGNNNSDVAVTTYTPQNITCTTADCGGDVIVTQGLSLNEIGVCWSNEAEPTVEDPHLSTTDWHNPFVCTLSGLRPGTIYYVRAYALRGLEYYYGEEKNFSTDNTSGHDFVDLGLPSGTLWATCNVGAVMPEESGYYFAWGEAEPKDSYSWSNYKYCYQIANALTKYCFNAQFGLNYFTDNLTALEPEDDAATVNWGDDWRTPTKEEFEELRLNTTQTWTLQNGMVGYLFTATNGNTLFFPAAGYMKDGQLLHYAAYGQYWTKAISEYTPTNGIRIVGSTTYFSDFSFERCFGLSVRPVRK
jgi:hypothetical protein